MREIICSSAKSARRKHDIGSAFLSQKSQSAKRFWHRIISKQELAFLTLSHKYFCHPIYRIEECCTVCNINMQHQLQQMVSILTVNSAIEMGSHSYAKYKCTAGQINKCKLRPVCIAMTGDGTGVGIFEKTHNEVLMSRRE